MRILWFFCGLINLIKKEAIRPPKATFANVSFKYNSKYIIRREKTALIIIFRMHFRLNKFCSKKLLTKTTCSHQNFPAKKSGLKTVKKSKNYPNSSHLQYNEQNSSNPQTRTLRPNFPQMSSQLHIRPIPSCIVHCENFFRSEKSVF